VKPAAADLEVLRGVCRRGIPPLPSPAFRLALALAGDEGSNNDLVVEQIETDPRLRFGILVGANVALFGRGRPVKTIRQAVAHLGRRKCLSLLWLVALSEFLQAWPDLHPSARDKLWRHSLLTGVLAHQLLHAAGLSALGDALAAGMAHDIGHLLLVSPGARLGVVWHEEHDQLVERSASPAPERDHCRLGASLLALWDAPSGLVASALHHHGPSAAEAADLPLVIGVRLADLLAEHIDLNRPARPLRLEVEPAWQQLAAFEPWNKVTDLHHLAIERLIDSLLIAEHLANLLGG
jgi:HD-like signal output (HDOD) protein